MHWQTAVLIKLSILTAGTSFNKIVMGEPLNKLKTMKFGLKKLETLFYHLCEMHFDTLNRIGIAYECDIAGFSNSTL